PALQDFLSNDNDDDDRLPPNHGPPSPSAALSFTLSMILAVHLDDVVGLPLPGRVR
ncbi:hypothetical protein GE21DRAFT_1221583, partial [Neurospora crassa]